MIIDREKNKKNFIDYCKNKYNNQFSYQEIVYINSKTKITFKCNKCLYEITTTPKLHRKSSKCPNCGKLKRTTEGFIKESQAIHGNKYKYTLAIYKGVEVKLNIICMKCNNIFSQTPHSHLKGQGCHYCNKKIKRNIQGFILEAKVIHNDKYDYTDSIYINSNSNMKIKCNSCLKIFEQTPTSHLKNIGCNICYGNMYDNNKFIKKSIERHGNKYNYDNVNYINFEIKVNITCNTCKNDFNQTPHSHLKGQGCPICAKKGFKINKPALLYYLSIDNGTAYKIGITNRSIKKRFSLKDRNKIKVLNIWKYNIGKDALNKEQEILKTYKNYKYDKKLLTNGNTELFNIDILKLNKVNIP